MNKVSLFLTLVRTSDTKPRRESKNWPSRYVYVSKLYPDRSVCRSAAPLHFNEHSVSTSSSPSSLYFGTHRSTISLRAALSNPHKIGGTGVGIRQSAIE